MERVCVCAHCVYKERKRVEKWEGRDEGNEILGLKEINVNEFWQLNWIKNWFSAVGIFCFFFALAESIKNGSDT